MKITDSLQVYQEACKEAEKIILEQQRRNRSVMQYGSSRGRINVSDNLMSYYTKIISLMFYELLTKRKARLLSVLCAQNGIQIDLKYFKIESVWAGNSREGSYDLVPFIDGLDMAFSGNLGYCSNLYMEQHVQSCFQGKILRNDCNSIEQVSVALRNLDEKMGQLLLTDIQRSSDKLKQEEEAAEQKKGEKSDIILRMYDPKLTDQFNKFAENRWTNDTALSEQIEKLQLSLQSELKQIMEIREGIDYSITQEAVSQFVALFSLVSETLQYHPNNENKDSYKNLIDSCEDFLENILQSLALLGVTVINDIGQPFDPGKHKLAQGIQPTRISTVSKIIKVGFIYKGKVIEKAIVELI